VGVAASTGGLDVTPRLEPGVLIARKRDGGELSAAELDQLVTAYLADDVSDAQMSAFLMAGLIRGFTDAEATALTESYLRSGDVVDLSALRGPTVDKHSTGGVGDTTTLVVAPLLAAVGCQVVKLSGRGLGHTGGTLDKLEAIAGFRVNLTPAEVHTQVEEIGVAVAAATATLVPADKRIYALRDVTGTVPSHALIAASIMSKKLAGGAQHIVLDVKVGDGAFLPDAASARLLAERCVAIGVAHGRATSALVTEMSQPLGPAIGNALEVHAAIDVLAGRGGVRLRAVSIALAAEALALTGVPRREATARVTSALDDGTALMTFARWVERQGGDPAVAENPSALLPQAPVIARWQAPAGTVRSIATRRLGELAGRLGAGRMRHDDILDMRVGLICHLALGEVVPDGPSIEVHASTDADAEGVIAELAQLIDVGDPIAPPPLVLARITADGGAR
jgi:pyrimidine-nucleoside phosphorylase